MGTWGQAGQRLDKGAGKIVRVWGHRTARQQGIAMQLQPNRRAAPHPNHIAGKGNHDDGEACRQGVEDLQRSSGLQLRPPCLLHT